GGLRRPSRRQDEDHSRRDAAHKPGHEEDRRFGGAARRARAGSEKLGLRIQARLGAARGAMPDTTILSWITAEVDQALERVRDQLASSSGGALDAAAISGCPEHLHQVSGALSMVGLSGAT